MPPQESGNSAGMLTGGRFKVRSRSPPELLEAKQRASIKWLLSKAYDHRTPEELREPFYKDHDDADHLKPHINRSLANAEFYCMALSVLYADPNFHNLNHWGIIQALARKGICVAEPSDCSLTESVLIQTSPLKMSAHMAVIEALMQLFIKEQVAVDRVLNTVKRFSAPVSTSEAPTDPDSALLLWSKRCCEALKLKIENEAEESEAQAKFPKVNDLSDLTDGVAITSVMALYCPEDLPWSSIALGDPPSMADSLYNIQLLQRFCKDSLPFNVCHLSIEDIVYMHDSIRLNVLAFLTDLFVGLEVKPVLRSIQLPGVKKDRIIEVPDPDLHRKNSPTGLKRLNSAIHQDQRSGNQPSSLTGGTSGGSDSPSSSEGFVVQRGRTVPTLTNIDSKSDKEQHNKDTKSEELGETSGGEKDVFQQMKNIPVAGRPSETNVTPRRASKQFSRRNSVDDNASTLSLENFGGSQDNLSLLGRNPDKEMRIHTGRRSDFPDNDNRYLDNKEVEEMERRQRESMSPMKTQFVRLNDSGNGSSSGSSSNNDKVSFADLRKQKARDQFHSSGINITYTEQEKEDAPKKSTGTLLSRRDSSQFQGQQKLLSSSNLQTQDSPAVEPQSTSPAGPDAMAAQLNSVRLKLESRRKRIEDEKRKMEVVMARQREKVGQEAFLRAVVKGTTNTKSSATNLVSTTSSCSISSSKPEPPPRPVTLKNLTEDLSAVQSKWLSDRNAAAQNLDPKTPDIEAMDIDTYSKSIYAMNDSLHDLQSDIQRLAQQQSQIQQIMHHSAIPPNSQAPNPRGGPPNPMDPQPFYISQPDPPQQRRTWGQPQPISFAHQQPGGGVDWPQQPPRRAQWGSPQPPPQRPQMMYDPYSGAPIDQWGQPVYNGYNPYQPQPQPHQQPQQQSPYSAYTNPTYGGGYNNFGAYPGNPGATSTPAQTQPGTSARTPFRLHDGSSPSPASKPLMTSSGTTPGSRASSTLPRRLSESQNDAVSSPMSPTVAASRPSYSRQTSRDSVMGSSSPNLQTRRPHTSVPAPEEDEMAPQSVSFIDSSAEDNDDEDRPSSTPSKRLSQLNITSGSKTYRVHEKEASPSPSRQRPTLSSAFKQSRRSSDGMNSGPSSLRSNSGVGLTEEEAEMLAAMKTEKLKDDADASKGFVISFDDDGPKKPKPALKVRRLSSKKNSLAGQSEMSSDGSNSSRKENVPPHDDIMICIDMNTGDESGSGSNDVMRTYRKPRNGGLDHWKSYDHEPLSSDQELSASNSTPIPKFEVDPEVPLETMVALDDIDHSAESDDHQGNKALIIGDDLVRKDPGVQDEMQRKKEKIMMQSLRRKQQGEENRLRKLEEEKRKKEDEARKEEERDFKKQEEKARREAILEQHKLKKAMDKAEEEGLRMPEPVSAKPVPKLRAKSASKPPGRPRPKTIHVDQDADVNAALGSRGPRGSISNISDSPRMSRMDRSARSMSQPRGKRDSSVSSAYGGAGGFRGSRESLHSGMTYSARRGSNASIYGAEDDYYYGGSMRDLSSRHGNRRKSSSASHIGPGSLPGYARRHHRGDYDDGASDISSTSGFGSAYGYRSGSRTRLYREPASKSNRTIVLNAIEFVVFPGVVNADTRNRVLDVIDRCDCPHFLLLFRDAKCQFRGLYAYYPDTEEVYKIYGTGPKQVTENMFETFFKYNSGGKKFTKIHTKHLTVTIDAFTIHNALWLGKKAKLPDKRDMALVV